MQVGIIENHLQAISAIAVLDTDSTAQYVKSIQEVDVLVDNSSVRPNNDLGIDLGGPTITAFAVIHKL